MKEINLNLVQQVLHIVDHKSDKNRGLERSILWQIKSYTSERNRELNGRMFVAYTAVV